MKTIELLSNLYGKNTFQVHSTVMVYKILTQQNTSEQPLMKMSSHGPGFKLPFKPLYGRCIACEKMSLKEETGVHVLLGAGERLLEVVAILEGAYRKSSN